VLPACVMNCPNLTQVIAIFNSAECLYKKEKIKPKLK